MKVGAMDVSTPGDDDGFKRISNEHMHMGSILQSIVRHTPSEAATTAETPRPEKICEDHYQRQERHFSLDCRWTWYIHGILTLVSIIMYWRVSGMELVYALYIPLDIMLNISLVVFFWYEYYKDVTKLKTKQEKQKKMESSLSVEEAIKRARGSVENIIAEVSLKSEKRLKKDRHLEQILKGAQKLILGPPVKPLPPTPAPAQDEKQVEKEGEEGLQKPTPAPKPPLMRETPKDTYVMAFKSLNIKVADELDLEHNEVMSAFQSALFVFVIQSMQITFIFSMLMAEDFVIIVPTTVVTMGARFIATILMHLSVEGDIRQGLVMMKYASNHPFEFLSPTSAFLVGLMQFAGGLGAELACILYLGKFDQAFLILIQFIALASVAKVDDIYFGSLSASLKITQPSQRLEVLVHKRDWENLSGTISPEFAPEIY